MKFNITKITNKVTLKNYSELSREKGIYCIYSKSNKKIYIGSTSDITGFKGRAYDHLYALEHQTHGNEYLQNTYNKYGVDNFYFIIIKVCNEKELENILSLEGYYIYKYKSHIRKYGFNIDTISSEGRRILSAETKNKIASLRTGKTHTPETKERIRKVKKEAYLKTAEKKILMYKNGRIFEFYSSRDFAKEHSLHSNIVNQVLKGIYFQTKGFHLPHIPYPYVQKSKKVKLCYKGKVCEAPSITLFAKKYNITTQSIRLILNGTYAGIKGFHLLNKPYIPPRAKEIKLKFKDGSIHEASTITAFCKKYRISTKTINRLLNNQNKEISGWSLPN